MSTSPAEEPESSLTPHVALPGVVVLPGALTGSRHPVGVRSPAAQLSGAHGPVQPVTTPRVQAAIRQRRIARAAISAGVAAIVFAVTIVAVSQSSGPSPQQQLATLFDALERRDGRAAMTTAGRCTDHPLCQAGALHGGYQPPRDVEIDQTSTEVDDTDRRGTHALGVSYTLGGTRHRAEAFFTSTGGIGRTWTMTVPPGGTLQLSNPAAFTVTVAAATTPLATTAPFDPATSPAGDPRAAVWLPPGVHTVTTPDDPLFEPVRAEVTVTGTTDPPPLSLAPRLRPAAVEEVNRQIRDRIDRCAAQAKVNPDTDRSPLSSGSCPFEHDSRYTDPEDVRWRIQRYPVVELRVADNATVTVVTIAPGVATISYRWTRDFVEPKDYADFRADEEFSIGGRVGVEQGKPLWKP